MKEKLLVWVRIAFGLMLIGFFALGVAGVQPPEAPPDAAALRDALIQAGYFVPSVYLVYLVVGAAYVTNRFVPLATLLLCPITLNIVLYHVFLTPRTLPTSAVLLVPNLAMIYACREAYKPLWRPSQPPGPSPVGGQ